MALRTAKAALSLPNLRQSAIFICDIQERFRTLIYEFDSVVQTSAKMLEAAKLIDMPVIVTEQNPKALGNTVKELNLKFYPPFIIQEKQRFSMLSDEITSLLISKSISDVILVGIESHVCILQTALCLLQQSQTQNQNINVHVLADGVSSCNRNEVPIALKRMSDAGAVITTSESILFQLLQSANHSKFKQLSKLIKNYNESTTRALNSLAGIARF